MAEDQELQAKIAELSGKINLHKQQSPASPGYASPQNPHSPGAAFSRSGYFKASAHWMPQRGTPYGYPRGRGGRYGAASHRHRTLVMNNAKPTEGSVQCQGSLRGGGDESSNPIENGSTPSGWISKRDRHHQLINNAIYEQKTQERAKAMEESAKQKQMERDEQERIRLAKHFRNGEHTSPAHKNFQHVITLNNFDFRLEDGGSRLVRVNVNPATARSTPKQVNIGGVSFRRSKNGNLYRAGLVRDRNMDRQRTSDKLGELCPKFTTTGTIIPCETTLHDRSSCPRGSRCHYTHDSDKVAICKDYLQSGSCRSGDVCDLSHDPSPHRVPSCIHFLRGNCTNEQCRYAHMHVNPGAPVCKAFARIGYCEKGPECTHRHVFECPDYSNKGLCRNKKCRLPHVDHAGQMRKAAVQQTTGGSDNDDAMSDFSSNDEYDEIDSDDVDSDELEQDIFVHGVTAGHKASDLSQQTDYVPF